MNNVDDEMQKVMNSMEDDKDLSFSQEDAYESLVFLKEAAERKLSKITVFSFQFLKTMH